MPAWTLRVAPTGAPAGRRGRGGEGERERVEVVERDEVVDGPELDVDVDVPELAEREPPAPQPATTSATSATHAIRPRAVPKRLNTGADHTDRRV